MSGKTILQLTTKKLRVEYEQRELPYGGTKVDLEGWLADNVRSTGINPSDIRFSHPTLSVGPESDIDLEMNITDTAIGGLDTLFTDLGDIGSISLPASTKLASKQANRGRQADRPSSVSQLSRQDSRHWKLACLGISATKAFCPYEDIRSARASLP